MPHPITFADDDPGLKELRGLVAALPGTAELLEDSYRQVVPKKLIAELELRRGPSGAD